MVHRYVAALAALALLAAALAALHQLVVDSPLFELGEEYWFPGVEDGLDLPAALGRLAVPGALPAAGTLAAAVLVLTAPFRVWLWGVVGVVALTTLASPLLWVYRLGCRPPTPAERERLAAAPSDGVRLCIVEAAAAGPVNGYAVGGPFADVVGVSRFALDRLAARELAAAVAHEVGHHRLHHALVRGGASVATLALGAAVLTAAASALTPAAAGGLLALVATERLVALWATRTTEYHADEFAARRTSPAAVLALLETLDAAVALDQRAVPWYERLLSTHPPYERRIARLRRRFDLEPPPPASPATE